MCDPVEAWLGSLEDWQWAAVRAALMRARPSLDALPDDVLLHVLRWLAEPGDRLAFALALLLPRALTAPCVPDPRVPRGAELFASIALIETAMVCTSKAIRVLADASLYATHHPPASRFASPSTRCLIVADWSVFTSRHVRPLATVVWSGRAPHARCDVDLAGVREHVLRCLRAGRPATRLAVLRVETSTTPTLRLRLRPCVHVSRIRVHGVPQHVHRSELIVLPLCFFGTCDAPCGTWMEDVAVRSHLQSAAVACTEDRAHAAMSGIRMGRTSHYNP